MKKKKAKFITPEMEFNPGLQKYEPMLPLRRGKEKVKKRIELGDMIDLIIMLVIVGIVIFLLVKYQVFLK